MSMKRIQEPQSFSQRLEKIVKPRLGNCTACRFDLEWSFMIYKNIFLLIRIWMNSSYSMNKKNYVWFELCFCLFHFHSAISAKEAPPTYYVPPHSPHPPSPLRGTAFYFQREGPLGESSAARTILIKLVRAEERKKQDGWMNNESFFLLFYSRTGLALDWTSFTCVLTSDERIFGSDFEFYSMMMRNSITSQGGRLSLHYSISPTKITYIQDSASRDWETARSADLFWIYCSSIKWSSILLRAFIVLQKT